MQGLMSSWPPRFAPGHPDQRRAAAVLAASLAFHAVVLGGLAMGALGFGERVFAPDDTTWIPVELEPRPLLPGERPGVRPPVADRPVALRTQAGPVELDPTRPPSLDDVAPTSPAPPAPRIAASPSATAPAPPDDPWRLKPEDTSAAVGLSLRGGVLGCRGIAATLTPTEQAACDQRLGEQASRAGPPGPRTLTPSEARREAVFAREGARALADYESRRRAQPGVGIVGASPECIGGNLRGTCAGAYLRPEYQHAEDAPFGGTAKPK